jgi:sec-independent protein translocase protein TatC
MIVVGSVFLTFLFTYSYAHPIMTYLQSPMNQDLVFIAPAEAFFVKMKVAFLLALAICVPIIIYQAWEFVAPGLLEKEKRYTLPFVLLATFFFLVGAAFCFYIVLPYGIQFLLGYGGDMIHPMISVGSYVSFVIKLMFAFGIVFELPLVIPFLVKLGVVTPAQLSHWRKYAIVFFFVIAAILTPPDVFTQIVMAVPLCLLYEVGIVAGKIFYRRKMAAKEAEEKDEEPVSVS